MAELSVRAKLNIHSNRRAVRSILAGALFAMLVVAGCNQGPPMSTVEGTVAYKDGTVPQGGLALVRFQPTEASTAVVRKGATGTIGTDGSFKMFTRKPGDGVHHGEYTVTVVVQKSLYDSRSMVDQKYSTPHTSPLKVLVDDDITDLKFEVEPPGGAPRG
jgi:hypothetical protein